ncbi:MAG: NEW3 domain-containing protein, partial [Gemmatimonadota bacterium]|nr:NEW3 domain-containing protein [Gemmatimonadota bacterium]
GQWPRELLLSDLVWAIRSFRPQVIVSVFSGTPSDGHGQHQAAGILTREAWDAAGDPGRFPEQLEQGVEPWTPLKLYRRTFFDPENATLSMDTGALDPLLGRSHHQIAMDSRSRHRSQDFGTAQQPGPRQTHLSLLETRVPSTDAEPLFTGVDTTFVTLAASLGAGGAAHVDAYQMAIRMARERLTVLDPAVVLPYLHEAGDHLDRLLALENAGRNSQLGREITRRSALIDQAVLAAAGVRFELRTRTEVLVPGQTALVEARIWSGGAAALDVTVPTIVVPAGWSVRPQAVAADTPVDDTGAFSRFFNQREEASPHDEVIRIEAGGMALWRYEVLVPDDPGTTTPYYLRNPRRGAIYDWTDDRTTRARPFQPPVLAGGVALTLHQGGLSIETGAAGAVRYRGVDKAAGEFWRPIQVAPRLSVAAASPTMIWPVGDNDPRPVELGLEGLDARGVAGTIELEVPTGWRVSPREVSFDLPGGSEQRVSFLVTPSSPAAEGEFELRPVVRTTDGTGPGMRVTVIDYPHIEPRVIVEAGAVRAIRFPVQVTDRRIGYVMGSGDEGPEAIQQLGLEIELIEPGAWSADRLDRFDTIVLGVRAYEVRPDLITSNGILLGWVERGGTLVTQYNKFEFNDGDYAPFPITVGRGRVTDENAEVRLLERESGLLSGPNEIRPYDFSGWVQERGLYYPEEWSGEYTELLSMRDPDEEAQTSSLLVAPYGSGLYVHTSLSFFRQLPAGVPGAYRLWANLLSIDARKWREATTS